MPLPGSVAPSRSTGPARLDSPPVTRRSALLTRPAPARVRLTVLVLAALVGAGAALRLWHLGVQRLGFDEAFTAIAARRPVGSLLDYLRVRDSHPPLDYLLRAPLARAGATEFVFRLPSAAFSIGALALFAWWMRDRGVQGVAATALLAFSTFQIVHGREARMYAELELLGVGAAVVADSWLRRPRRWHAPTIGLIVLAGLLTHVSMFVFGAGLVALAGRRNDRAAWSWRVALAGAAVVWATTWGPSFVTQSQGGHSSWIPATTVAGIVRAVGGLVTPTAGLQGAALAATAVGALLLWRSDRRLARVFTCCVLVPAALTALLGLRFPVLLDRTLTLSAWGPGLALGSLVAAVARRSSLVAGLAAVALAVVVVPPSVDAVTAPSNVDRAIRHVEQVAAGGDVVASHSGGRLHILLWSLGVRDHRPYRPIRLAGPGDSRGVRLGNGPASGRTWLLVSTPLPAGATPPRCAPDWTVGALRVLCLRDEVLTGSAPVTGRPVPARPVGAGAARGFAARSPVARLR